MSKTGTLLAGAASAVLMLSQSAGAQQEQEERFRNAQQAGQQLAQREVQSFLRQMEDDLTQAVQSGDLSSIRQWSRSKIADNAKFIMAVEVTPQNGSPKSYSFVNTDKQALLQRLQIGVSLVPDLLDRVQDYDLRIRVQDVDPLGPDAALVQTRITESGSIDLTGGQRQTGARMGYRSPDQQSQTGGGDDQNTAAGRQDTQGQRNQRVPQQVSFDANSTCQHLIQREQSSGELQLGWTSCQSQLSF